MVQINEMRFNSAIKCKISNDAGVYRIMAIHLYGVELSGARSGSVIPFDKIKGIKITEDILLKSGFTKTHNRIHDNDHNIYFEFDVKGKIYDCTIHGNRFCFLHSKSRRDKMIYVHQLQNLNESLSDKA